MNGISPGVSLLWACSLVLHGANDFANQAFHPLRFILEQVEMDEFGSRPGDLAQPGNGPAFPPHDMRCCIGGITWAAGTSSRIFCAGRLIALALVSSHSRGSTTRTGTKGWLFAGSGILPNAEHEK